jgi:predicted nucleic acid-binding Zn ribbon protein
MDKAADLLGRVARRLRRPEAPIVWLASSWPRIVGRTVAAHTRPVRCQDGCLEIDADAKVWQRQLESMALDFCSQINRAWGSALVREVKFATAANRCAGASGSAPAGSPARRTTPYELDNDHLPFIRRRK